VALKEENRGPSNAGPRYELIDSVRNEVDSDLLASGIRPIAGVNEDVGIKRDHGGPLAWAVARSRRTAW
jgi:hypothetical protein